MEAVLFVPATPGSELRKLIQKAEDQASKLMNSPTVRVVERARTKIMQEVGDNNPWKKEWCCPRKTYPPCQGQALLGAEKEEESLRLVCGNVEGQTGETKKGSWLKDDCRSLPGCTGEGCNYVIECLSCRKAGLKRRYYGETSRSPYQRINEHLREVREGVATHPLVAHFREEYGSLAQEILMRILPTHLTPLDR